VAAYAADRNDTVLKLRKEPCSIAIGCEDDFRGFDVTTRGGDSPVTRNIGDGRDRADGRSGLKIHAFLKDKAKEM